RSLARFVRKRARGQIASAKIDIFHSRERFHWSRWIQPANARSTTDIRERSRGRERDNQRRIARGLSHRAHERSVSDYVSFHRHRTLGRGRERASGET